jgi:hypothetical protein
MPTDVLLLDFYILPDGTGVADFADGLASEVPSGVLSEQLVIDSIARTLENNVPSLRRLKILIHGQEVDTLAGNVDLTGFFDLNPPALQQTAPSLNGATSVPGENPLSKVGTAAASQNSVPGSAPTAGTKASEVFSAPSRVVTAHGPYATQGGKP